MKTWGSLAAIAVSTVFAASASAQLTLALDINGFDYQFKDSGGGLAFGGDTHTGSVEWSFATTPTTIVDARMGFGGSTAVLSPVALGATLTDFSGSLTLVGGNVTGGSVEVELSSGDTYTATVQTAGDINTLTTGGFTIDGLTMDGQFSDALFGAIDVSEFVAAQGDPGQLIGSLFKFRFDPSATGAGNGDMEIYVLVPLPPAAYAGLATLAGVMCLTYIRRRR